MLRNILLFLLALCGSGFAQSFPVFIAPTPLIGAVMRNDAAEVDRLLTAGADPNEGEMLGSNALMLALAQRNERVVKALLDKGANVNVADAAGSTTLMWAAATESGDAGIVNELLRRGVDPNAVNKMGETALQWAMRRGYTPVTQALLRAGASERAMVKQSVEKASALLAKSAPEFIKVSGCTSCHNQSLPQMTWHIARDRGFATDAEVSAKQRKAVIAMFKPAREMMLAGKEGFPDPALSVSYSLVGLAAEGHAPDETTEAMAHLVAVQQRDDGGFHTMAMRPPIESNEIAAAALSIRALQVYGMAADNPADRVRRGVAWLKSAKPVNTEERAMQLLGLVWGGTEPRELERLVLQLKAEQRQDGGWAQLDQRETDAYATGQAMVALQASGLVKPGDDVYQAGVAYLLRTQLPDGSWLVRSRSFPFQPYKESGFPHGKDQWISAAGTSWAAMALALTAPPLEQPGQQLSRLF